MAAVCVAIVSSRCMNVQRVLKDRTRVIRTDSIDSEICIHFDACSSIRSWELTEVAKARQRPVHRNFDCLAWRRSLILLIHLESWNCSQRNSLGFKQAKGIGKLISADSSVKRFHSISCSRLKVASGIRRFQTCKPT